MCSVVCIHFVYIQRMYATLATLLVIMNAKNNILPTIKNYLNWTINVSLAKVIT